MGRIAIITDSSSGITQQEAGALGIRVVPLSFTVDDMVYEEGVTLSRDFFFQQQARGAVISTAQPPPQRVMELWSEALETCDEVLHVPISSDLSGSCQTAKCLAGLPEFAGRVFVADAHRIATPLRWGLMDALRLAEAGHSGEELCALLEAEPVSVFLAVDTLKYLQQGGRISAATAVVGTMLSIKPVVEIRREINLVGKSRGMKHARRDLLERMKVMIAGEYRQAAETGQLYLMAASSATEKETADWVDEIRQAFPGYEVKWDDLSLSICCHTGPGALGIGCARRL